MLCDMTSVSLTTRVRYYDPPSIQPTAPCSSLLPAVEADCLKQHTVCLTSVQPLSTAVQDEGVAAQVTADRRSTVHLK